MLVISNFGIFVIYELKQNLLNIFRYIHTLNTKLHVPRYNKYILNIRNASHYCT